MSMIPHRESRFQINSAEASSEKTVRNEEVVVRTNGLQKFFGDFEAVKRLTFEVRRGEIFGLLGPNGAGKSTTFRMLCGLLSVSAGEISVAGYNLRHSPSRARARLGYMAQQFSLYGQLSVQENLNFFGKAYGLGGNRLRHRIEWAFTEFGLGKWKDKTAGQLPGGYKQRLAMAASLLHEPDILFLDEPTSGVDPLARREFWLRINGFAELGMTVVVTTHFMEESEYCDRMLILSQGENLAMGTPSEIRGLARSKKNPEPSIEDAFIALAQGDIAPSAGQNFIENGGGRK
jgi:ABC-2 type transport system ATP-binding protein